MSLAHSWFAARRPSPPRPLAEELATDVESLEGETEGTAEATVDALLRRARERLDRARSAPGRVRSSAFELLASDALITYACEAALESESPEAALTRILTVGGPR